MIPDSIRWRLPLTYAGISLLATLLLGAIMLLGLRSYYDRRESDYLETNARAIAAQAALMLQLREVSEVVESQAQVMAVLSQTRVRFTDSDGGLLADSGSPTDLSGIDSLSVGMELNGVSQDFSQSVDAQDGSHTVTSKVSVREPGTASMKGARTEVSTSVTVRGDSTSLSIPLEMAGRSAVDELMQPSLPIVPAVGAQLGLDLDPSNETGRQRSSKTVTYPIASERGGLVGYVELSEGPAFGVQVLKSVAWGWAISSIIAVLLATAVGWLVSLRVTRPVTTLADTTGRMASGELSARADVNRNDELGQLADAFNQMATRVEETVETLRRFVGDAAHQLLTPMTALRTDIDLLRSTEDEGARVQLADRISQQLDRMDRLCAGLLDLSRLESGSDAANKVPVDLASLVQEQAETFASRAEQKGVEFELELPDEPIEIRGDESALRQAVANLIDNAVKFTSDGGTVSVSVVWKDSDVLINVQDTGIGVPESDIPQLFDRFHRGRNASDHPGSGLGLAIVKAVADAHNGQVWCEAVRPLGSRFCLRIPA